MDDAVEFSGRTVEDAISQAERTLGVNRSELEISVITAGRGGVFGIGAEPARVAVRQPSLDVLPEAGADESDSWDTETSAFEDHEDMEDEDGEEEHPRSATATAIPSSRPSQDGRDLAEEGQEVLRELLDVMGFDAEVAVRSTENPIMLAVQGDNSGVLIGRRGDNLAALQFMVNLILSKNRRQWPRIVVDIENYRERREESLRSLADRIGQRVRRSGKAFTLEAMAAGDRRIIHLTLRDALDVETYSIGEGPARRVVVAPKRISRSETSRTSPERTPASEPR
ncbi:MAG: RNA-binding cell elongation regulator Jag/EloR [Chloroflexota bacterium]